MAVVLPFVATFVDKGAKEAIKAIKGVEQTWGKTGGALKKAAGPAAAIGGALVTGMGLTKKAAGDAAKSQKVLASAMRNAGYEENAKAVGEYATELSKSTGIDANSIRMAQARLATNKDLAKDTEALGKVTMLAADMSAQGFGSMESASATLTKALADPVKGMAALARMGIVFDATTKASVKSAVESGDTLAAQQMILAKVVDTVGGSAEKNASSTGKMRAQYQELAVMIGNALLPIWGKMVAVLSQVIGWMTQHTAGVKTAVVVIGSLVTAILALNAIMKVQETVTKAVTAVRKLLDSAFVKNIGTIIKATATIAKNTVAMLAQKAATLAVTVAQKAAKIATTAMTVAQKLLNNAMRANPIGLVITAIAALVAILKYAWQNSETFRRIVTKAFNAVKSVAQTVFGAIVRFIQPVIDALQAVIKVATKVADSISGVIKKIPGLKNASKAASDAAAGPTTASSSRAFASGQAAGPSVVINVTGALDPERVARQIRDLLDNHDLRQGRIVSRAVAW